MNIKKLAYKTGLSVFIIRTNLFITYLNIGFGIHLCYLYYVVSVLCWTELVFSCWFE